MRRFKQGSGREKSCWQYREKPPFFLKCIRILLTICSLSCVTNQTQPVRCRNPLQWGIKVNLLPSPLFKLFRNRSSGLISRQDFFAVVAAYRLILHVTLHRKVKWILWKHTAPKALSSFQCGRFFNYQFFNSHYPQRLCVLEMNATVF